MWHLLRLILILSGNTLTMTMLTIIVCTMVWMHWGGKKLRSGADIAPPPGPTPWPLIGSLHLMAGFDIPYAAFTTLQAVYGNVFGIRLGSTKCIVVNDPNSVREVLITKGAHFDGRPDFRRLDVLFGGDKNNSLAFSNYTPLQKKRRQLLKLFTFPHAQSANFNTLDQICQMECARLVNYIKVRKMSSCRRGVVDLKSLILMASGNIFNAYFCSARRFEYDDDLFWNYCQNYDEVFWEVNNGRLVDFLPWLMPLMSAMPAMKKMKQSSRVIRNFVEENIIEPKRLNRGGDSTNDFLDNLMSYLDKHSDDPEEMDRQSALYALEDILGGQSAVANIVIRILIYLAMHQSGPQRKLQEEIDRFVGCSQPVTLNDKKDLLWTNAAVYETIRLTCSPIVPHVASQDSTIAGYKVDKDTVVFINNHNLNMSDKLWHNPEDFDPSRFLNPVTGKFSKPEFFQPYSVGRRSCMGYKMVQNITFSLVSSLLQNFSLSMHPKQPKMTLGMLALPPQPFFFDLNTRQPDLTI